MSTPDLIVTLDAVSANPTTVTRAELKALARFYIDELTAGRLQDTTAGQYGLDEALTEAYVEYYKATHCCPYEGQATAVVDTATYAYTSFDASGRLFDVSEVYFNGSRLDIVAPEDVSKYSTTWRFDASGTPVVAMPYGEDAIRLWPKPSSALPIDIAGYRIPDLSTFTEETDSPVMHQSRAKLLAAYAAGIVCIRFAGMDEITVQESRVWQLWATGIAQANKEIHGSHRITTVMSRYADITSGMEPGYNRGATLITPA